MRCLILTIACFLSTQTFAQLNLKVDKLTISNIVMDFGNNGIIIDENLQSGPSLGFDCVFENNTDSMVTLYPSTSLNVVTFHYCGKQYDKKIMLSSLSGQDTPLIVMPNQKVEMFFGLYLLQGTPANKHKQCDYTKELLKILPTLKVAYKDKSNYIQVSEISDVVLQ